MTLRSTERRADFSIGIDASDDATILGTLLDGQARAVASVRAALPALARLANEAVARLDGGGRLIYLAAGSPGLIALTDALEIPQTYGEPADRFVALIAGGRRMTETLLGGPEDDAAEGARDVAAAGVGPSDCLVAISASGSTPYTLAGMIAAKDAGAITGAIANNCDAPLLLAADVPVLLDTGEEVVAGSTRMAAGTAQKAALNMLSTLIAIRRGHVHDGHMVGLRADNAKLRQRAVRMVGDVAGVAEADAAAALEAAGGDVKLAALIAAGASRGDAGALLARHRGRLRPALEDLRRVRPALDQDARIGPTPDRGRPGRAIGDTGTPRPASGDAPPAPASQSPSRHGR